MSAESSPSLSWNLGHDIGRLFEYHFMINALLAGSAAAVLAAAAGWMMVLRHETFAGHTLAVMSFPGAAAAALAGVPAAVGYLAFCSSGALAIARLPRGGGWREESAGTGAVQALALALGFLFVSLYGGVLGDLESLLFGDVLGVSDGQVLELAVLAALTLAVLAAIGRPLLFASVDPVVAASRGVPVARLSSGFLLLLGLAVAATSQVTGPLLVLALLVMPAASAQALSARPLVSLALSIAIGLLVVWVSLAASYYSVYPPGFFIGAVAFAGWLLARGTAALRGRRRRPALAARLTGSPPGAPA
ncbi:MAG TPA: metal ABC transporter permease [Solirubrobacteraceae bacterium]|jgi:zinc/manganese transport system permease protein